MKLSLTSGRSILIACMMTLILGAASLGGCNGSIVAPDTSIGELPRELSAAETRLLEADRSFSHEIFRRTVLHDTDSENLFISPLSISMALSMTLNGAREQTYQEMAGTLQLEGMDIDEINEAFGQLMDLLTDLDPAVTVRIANSVWHEQFFEPREDFLERLLTHYKAEVNGIDFADPASADLINNWVYEQTEGLIDEIIDEIPNDAILYLINALYFDGEWRTRFNPDLTHNAPFYPEADETVQVEMMQLEHTFAHFRSNEVEMIEIPYGDSLYSMSVILPGDSDRPIRDFIDESLTASNLQSWRNELEPRTLELHLPKFKLEYELGYNEILQAMGMKNAFDPGSADFTGIRDVSPDRIYISDVKHKTFVNVDEEGTEAAAVTSVEMRVTAAGPQMVIDRPFVFLIHERESGATLFMGKVGNPVGE